MTQKQRDYQFGALIIVIASFLSSLLPAYIFWMNRGYYSDGDAPNGWYIQRQYINATYMVRDNEIMFAVCDHSYLGPLHGFWKLGPNVNFQECGWYNLRVENGVIVEVDLRQKG